MVLKDIVKVTCVLHNVSNLPVGVISRNMGIDPGRTPSYLANQRQILLG